MHSLLAGSRPRWACLLPSHLLSSSSLSFSPLPERAGKPGGFGEMGAGAAGRGRKGLV